jgi:hypothetical protein
MALWHRRQNGWAKRRIVGGRPRRALKGWSAADPAGNWRLLRERSAQFLLLQSRPLFRRLLRLRPLLRPHRQLEPRGA